MTCAVLGFLGRSILRPRLRLIYTYDPITGNLVSKAGVNYTYQPAGDPGTSDRKKPTDQEE